MQLSRAIAIGVSAIAAILMFAALWVPWQGGAIFGFTAEPGLWNIFTEGFGSSEYASYGDDPDANQTLIVIARIVALMATIGAIMIVLLPLIPGDRPPRTMTYLMAGSSVAAALALVLFDAGLVQYYGDDARSFFDLHHGSNLFISASVFLSLAALVDLFLDRFWNYRLVKAAEPGEDSA